MKTYQYAQTDRKDLCKTGLGNCKLAPISWPLLMSATRNLQRHLVEHCQNRLWSVCGCSIFDAAMIIRKNPQSSLY